MNKGVDVTGLEMKNVVDSNLQVANAAPTNVGAWSASDFATNDSTFVKALTVQCSADLHKFTALCQSAKVNRVKAHNAVASLGAELSKVTLAELKEELYDKIQSVMK